MFNTDYLRFEQLINNKLGRGSPNWFIGRRVTSLQTSFHTTFKENCGGGQGLGTTTWTKNEFEGKQWHVSCKIYSLKQMLIFLS